MPTYTITIRRDGTSTVTHLPDRAALITHVRDARLPARITSDLTRRSTTVMRLRDGSELTAHEDGPLDNDCPTCHVIPGVPCQGPSGRTRRDGPHPARYTA